jgi:hypothetical protein
MTLVNEISNTREDLQIHTIFIYPCFSSFNSKTDFKGLHIRTECKILKNKLFLFYLIFISKACFCFQFFFFFKFNK